MKPPTTQQRIERLFSNLPVPEQVSALRALTRLHFQKQRKSDPVAGYLAHAAAEAARRTLPQEHEQ